MKKMYQKPRFELVMIDEANHVFFTASGGGAGGGDVDGGINEMNSYEGEW